MAVTKAVTPFAEYLPAVLRSTGRGPDDFLGAFLGVFEQVFTSVQSELDALPDLFALPPTPVLAVAVAAEECTLLLDSAAGLCPGDILHLYTKLEMPREFVEVYAVESAASDLLPTRVHLCRPLRFRYTAGARIALVGRPGPSANLSLGVSAGQSELTVIAAPVLAIGKDDILRIGDDETTEYVQTQAVDGVKLTIAPPLQWPHTAGQSVVLMQAVAATTPPAAFAYAPRRGAELVLRCPALAQEQMIEVDTLSGLKVDDILHIQDAVPAAVEFVQVAKLRVTEGKFAVLRRGLYLHSPLRFAHAAGSAIGVLGAPAGETTLAKVVDSTTLEISNAAFLGAALGDVLQIGANPTPEDENTASAVIKEYGQVLSVTENQESGLTTIRVTPALTQTHVPGEPVIRLAPAGGDSAFLRWLANWIGLELRPDRGERWNRELLRLAGRIWPWRGTKQGVEAFLRTYLRGEAASVTVCAPANPLQIGLVSTVGEDTVIDGSAPYFFWVDVTTDPRNSRLYHADGLQEMMQAARVALDQVRPAHTDYELRIQAQPLQIGVASKGEIGARVGDTTLVCGAPLTIPSDLFA